MDSAVEIQGLGKKFDLPLKPSGGLYSFLPERLLPKAHYEDFWALRDVNLTIPKARMMGIIGRNGSGKSTLLKIIAGILKPTHGTITTHGSVAALLELGAGFHEELSGMENIFLNAAILGLSRKEIKKILPSIIEFSGLERFLYTPIRHYSTGMQARLGFSIAINMNPDILLVDEVISVGDREFQSKCISKIAEFRSQGRTIVLVTHDIDMANFVCDELVWLESGQVRSTGPSGQVAHEYRSHIFETLSRDVPSGDRIPSQTRQNPVILHGRFLDEKGEEKTSFIYEQNATLEIPYDTGGEALERPGVRVVVTRHDNLVVAEIDSADHGFAPEKLKGKGTILIHFRPLLFLKSKYDVSIVLYHRDHPEKVYDTRMRLDEFEISVLKGAQRPGLIAHVPCEWVIRGAHLSNSGDRFKASTNK